MKNLRESLGGKNSYYLKWDRGNAFTMYFPQWRGTYNHGPGGRGRLFERIFSMEALWVAGLKLRRPTKHVLWEQTFENRNFQNFAKM